MQHQDRSPDHRRDQLQLEAIRIFGASLVAVTIWTIGGPLINYRRDVEKANEQPADQRMLQFARGEVFLRCGPSEFPRVPPKGPARDGMVAQMADGECIAIPVAYRNLASVGMR